MLPAVIGFWTSCLGPAVCALLRLAWTAIPPRRLLGLAVLMLALSSCRTPEEMRRKYKIPLEAPPDL